MCLESLTHFFFFLNKMVILFFLSKMFYSSLGYLIVILIECLIIFSSPELLPSANVHRLLSVVSRASPVVRRLSSRIASNDISSETAEPRAFIFGM